MIEIYVTLTVTWSICRGLCGEQNCYGPAQITLALRCCDYQVASPKQTII